MQQIIFRSVCLLPSSSAQPPAAGNSMSEGGVKVNIVYNIIKHLYSNCTISKHIKKHSVLASLPHLHSPVCCLTSSGIPFWQYNLVSKHDAQWTRYAHAGQHSPSCCMGVAHVIWGHLSVVHVTCFSCRIKQTGINIKHLNSFTYRVSKLHNQVISGWW